MPILTQELLDRCWNACRVEISSAVGEHEQPQEDRSLHMNAAAFLDAATWKVITPFLVSFSAGVAAAAINAKWIRQQPIKGLKEMIVERMGQQLRINPSRVEESVLLIEEILQPFGVNRDKARKIVAVLLSTAGAPTDQSGQISTEQKGQAE